MNLAPIILFVYNRPWHTRQTVEALQKNKLADNSELFIYCDGSKGEQDLQKVLEVRDYLATVDGFKNITIVEKEKNYGLADSIISGVTEIVNRYGKIIVLEDDLVVSQYFLKYMNESLDYYQNEERVMHISAWSYPAFEENSNTTFLWRVMNCWGWGTWSDSWWHFEKNPQKLISTFDESDIARFDLDSTMDFWKQVVANNFGSINSWAVFWYSTIFSMNGLCLNPTSPLLQNIGHGLDATHAKSAPIFCDHNVNKESNFVFQECIKENADVVKKIKDYWLATYLKDTRQLPLDYYSYSLAKSTPRFTEMELKLFGKKILVPDSASLLFLVKELFEFEIYKFKADTKQPHIIDCGANIGLSIIYFKRLYPNAKIIAFEPDPKIFNYLERNVASFGFEGVELVNKALWDSETELEFYSEGADGGRIKEDGDKEKIVKIQTEKLSKYLHQKVDFLKLDIEGAEYEVLNECKDLLKNVENIFVEYHSFVGKRQNLWEILKILEESGFRYYIEHTGVKSAHPFENISNYVGFDNQLNIFGYRQ